MSENMDIEVSYNDFGEASLSGVSGNQFKNAPVAGHCMAELVDACEKGHNHDADPLKVKTVYTGLELNMGFYSRNREINSNSSFSVNG